MKEMNEKSKEMLICNGAHGPHACSVHREIYEKGRHQVSLHRSPFINRTGSEDTT